MISDAFSGITANPTVGRVTDLMCNLGGSVILTETPEMFGAEQLLMNRAKNKDVFEAFNSLIDEFISSLTLVVTWLYLGRFFLLSRFFGFFGGFHFAFALAFAGGGGGGVVGGCSGG